MAAWQAAGIALAIGFLIGAERERDGGPAGVRTFALAGLSGAIAALVHPLVLGAAAVYVGPPPISIAQGEALPRRAVNQSLENAPGKDPCPSPPRGPVACRSPTMS